MRGTRNPQIYLASVQIVKILSFEKSCLSSSSPPLTRVVRRLVVFVIAVVVVVLVAVVVGARSVLISVVRFLILDVPGVATIQIRNSLDAVVNQLRQSLEGTVDHVRLNIADPFR